MRMISSGFFNNWLKAYGSAWENSDSHKAVALFSPDGSYREKPFEPAIVGTEAIKRYWQEGAIQSQKEITLTYKILSVRDNVGIAPWQADFIRIPCGDQGELDGIMMTEFDESGLCIEFKEWWHRREISYENHSS